MKRRHFLLTASAAAIAGQSWGCSGGVRFRQMPKELMVAIATQPVNAATKSKSGVTSSDEILWSVSRAYQRLVYRAEGTYKVPGKPNLNPYKTQYTYQTFDSFSDHPRESFPIPGTGLTSDAAGAPQFISSTWDELKAKNDFWYPGESFSPQNQDLGFLYLHNETGGHHALSAGCRTFGGRSFLTFGAFKKTVFHSSAKWASLPGHNIGAASGQHTRDIFDLWSWFSWELNEEQGFYQPTLFPIKGFAPGESNSEFGWRRHPLTGFMRFHAGADWPTPTGTEVLAPEDGRVYRQWLSGGGNVLLFRPKSDPFKLVRFMHLDKFSPFNEGDWVGQGDVLAYTGNTGSSTTGPHVHGEVWQGLAPEASPYKLKDNKDVAPVNPVDYFSQGIYLNA